MKYLRVAQCAAFMLVCSFSPASLTGSRIQTRSDAPKQRIAIDGADVSSNQPVAKLKGAKVHVSGRVLGAGVPPQDVTAVVYMRTNGVTRQKAEVTGVWDFVWDTANESSKKPTLEIAYLRSSSSRLETQFATQVQLLDSAPFSIEATGLQLHAHVSQPFTVAKWNLRINGNVKAIEFKSDGLATIDPGLLRPPVQSATVLGQLSQGEAGLGTFESAPFEIRSVAKVRLKDGKPSLEESNDPFALQLDFNADVDSDVGTKTVELIDGLDRVLAMADHGGLLQVPIWKLGTSNELRLKAVDAKGIEYYSATLDGASLKPFKDKYQAAIRAVKDRFIFQISQINKALFWKEFGLDFGFAVPSEGTALFVHHLRNLPRMRSPGLILTVVGLCLWHKDDEINSILDSPEWNALSRDSGPASKSINAFAGLMKQWGARASKAHELADKFMRAPIDVNGYTAEQWDLIREFGSKFRSVESSRFQAARQLHFAAECLGINMKSYAGYVTDIIEKELNSLDDVIDYAMSHGGNNPMDYSVSGAWWK